MGDETNAPKAGIIRRETRIPDGPGEWILPGPHIGVANPFQKTPRHVCTANGYYDLLDLTTIPEDYLPRTNYVPACDPATYPQRIAKVDWDGALGFDRFYRFINREMISQTGERTLVCAIYPPGTGHINVSFDVAFKELELLLDFTGMGHANRFGSAGGRRAHSCLSLVSGGNYSSHNCFSELSWTISDACSESALKIGIRRRGSASSPSIAAQRLPDASGVSGLVSA